MNAYEWGLTRESCPEALEWRKSLGPDATQADVWRLCQRGDWMIWQLRYGLLIDELRAVMPALLQAAEKTVEREIRRVSGLLRGSGEYWAAIWQAWAETWLSGVDRSSASARRAAADTKTTEWLAWADAARAAARVAWVAETQAVWMTGDVETSSAWVAAVTAPSRAVEAVWKTTQEDEQAQADAIRAGIPEWPGGLW